MKKQLLFAGIILFACASLHAQTWSKIHSIFQANCVTACHGGANPLGQLDLSGTETDVYNALIGATPVNPAAQAKNYKLIDPGYPHRSFLLRKINNGLDPDRDIETAEGTLMPPAPQPALSNADIELVSSWILHGAPQSGDVVDEQAIIDYYNGMGMSDLAPPPAPDTSEGIQVHFGSIYLAAGEEIEFMKKHEMTSITENVEITRLHAFINGMSHHYLMYKYDTPGDASGTPEGLRTVNISNPGTNAALVSGWQDTNDQTLPEGTGYFWETGAVLDLNYHFLNWSQDSVLKAELYTNIYYQPKQTNTLEMHSDLYINPSTFILNDSQDHIFTDGVFDGSSNETWYVWLLSSHTHKYGVDYDIFLRNSNGTKGQQVYEGFYDYYYTFNQGYYEWEHPAIRYFEPALVVPLNEGFIHEATFNNDGPVPVSFGLTTDDEMMLMFVQYTTEDFSVGLSENEKEKESFKVYPNPASDATSILFKLEESSNLKIELYELLGKKVAHVASRNFEAGNHVINMDTEKLGLSPGFYLVKMKTNEKISTQKLVVH
ncbi:MAG: hypothetical protein COA57_15480 [Flavobacteriales bacterium]|nr:MAG: hypothetical protein COA57_15480 [Flavobacteriales bacterium]